MVALAASVAPAALPAGNLPNDVLTARGRGNGLSLLGGGVCLFWRPHQCQVCVAVLAASLALADLTVVNLLDGVLPVRQRGNGLSLLGEWPSADPGGLIGARSS